MAGTEHSTALNCDFKKCRCWEELLEKCFCNSSAHYVLQMSYIWTTENFVSLFCNLDSVLHLLLPPTRFLCQFWHIWKSFRPPFENLSVLCTRHTPKISQGWIILLCQPTVKLEGMREELGNPYPTGSFFQGGKGWKGLSGALWLLKGFFQLSLCIGILSLRFPWKSWGYREEVGVLSDLLTISFFMKWISEAAVVIRITLATPGLLWQVGAGRVQWWQTSTSSWELCPLLRSQCSIAPSKTELESRERGGFLKSSSSMW